MVNLRLKRKSIELKSYEAWLTRGRGGFHFENSKIFSYLVDISLRVSGLRKRGERNALNIVVKEIKCPFDTLANGFSGFKILHLSDIHADGLPGLAETISCIIKEIEIDLCVLTGDYRFEVYGPCHNVYENMEKILSSVNSSHGILGILGNHDFAEEVVELERMGVKMLINEAYELRIGNDSIWFVGVDDPHYYGCDNLEEALNGVPENAFKVLLVHTPEILQDAEKNDIDLYLCGHTHAGQICLPFLGPILVNANCPRKYTRGKWQYMEVKGYTNAGVGSSCVPVRFFCPPEIGIVELHCTT